MNQNHASNYCSQFLQMSYVFVPLFCRLNCSMFSDDEGSDEELNDTFPVENERYLLFHIKVLPQKCIWVFFKTFYL